MNPAQANKVSQPAAAAAISASGADSREFKKSSNAQQGIDLTELAASLDRIQPYTVIDERGSEVTCVGLSRQRGR